MILVVKSKGCSLKRKHLGQIHGNPNLLKATSVERVNFFFFFGIKKN